MSLRRPYRVAFIIVIASIIALYAVSLSMGAVHDSMRARVTKISNQSVCALGEKDNFEYCFDRSILKPADTSLAAADCLILNFGGEGALKSAKPCP
jgi:hypothetical protein